MEIIHPRFIRAVVAEVVSAIEGPVFAAASSACRPIEGGVAGLSTDSRSTEEVVAVATGIEPRLAARVAESVTCIEAELQSTRQPTSPDGVDQLCLAVRHRGKPTLQYWNH